MSPVVPLEQLGDVEAMRALGRTWAARAAQLEELAGVIASTIGDMGLEGPGAGHLTGRCDAARQTAVACARDLHGLAAQLLADAGEVERREAKAKAEAATKADVERLTAQHAAAAAQAGQGAGQVADPGPGAAQPHQGGPPTPEPAPVAPPPAAPPPVDPAAPPATVPPAGGA